MEEQEVITNDTNFEDVSTDVTNEISTNSETTPQVVNPDAVDFDAYRASYTRYSLDKELYTINLYASEEAELNNSPYYTFSVPREYADSITVINGMIYNFGDRTIRLSSGCDYAASTGADYQYYVTLEIPVYNSPEYHACLSEAGNYSEMNSSPYPCNLYLTTNQDGLLYEQEISLQGYFKAMNSPMVSWSPETIFIFIILILLIGKTVFRKG